MRLGPAGTAFDPTELTEDLTPAAAHAALAAHAYPRALLIALRLKDPHLQRHVLLSTPAQHMAAVTAAIPAAFVPQLLGAVAELMTDSPHVQFLLQWVRTLCTRHGQQLSSGSGAHLPVLRAVQKSLNRMHSDLGAACESNVYTLDFLTAWGNDS